MERPVQSSAYAGLCGQLREQHQRVRQPKPLVKERRTRAYDTKAGSREETQKSTLPKDLGGLQRIGTQYLIDDDT